MSIMERALGPGQVGKFRAEQLAQRGTWARIPDYAPMEGLIHAIRFVPANGSTITELNPLDPATVADVQGPSTIDGPCHLDRPHGDGRLWANR